MPSRGSSPVLGVALAATLLAPAVAWAANCQNTSTGLVPLSDLATGLYLGQFQGGLYPSGSNVPPPAHLDAGLAAAASVVPRDGAGNPDAPNGRIVFISLGMSNTTLEFCRLGSGTTGCTAESFMAQAAADPAVNHTTLAIVNGAQGGQDAKTWLDPAAPTYANVASLLGGQGLTEAQVQVVWVKQADAGPSTSLPAAGADAYTLEGYLGAIARTLRARYPKVAQVYYSSRIYAGYATTALNPEPYAYESGFAVKWVVEAQIHQMATPGNPADPIAGNLNYVGGAPWVAWGPYLWADGTTPRGDGLTYVCTDLRQSDGTHPDPGAVQKVGSLLLAFFKTSPASQPWFLAAGASTSTTATTSTTTTTLPLPACGAAPLAGCEPAAPGRSRLVLRRNAVPSRNRLTWKWTNGAATPKADFGDPLAATIYGLCVYDAGGLVLQMRAPAGGTCGAKPCWRDTGAGFRYADRALAREGLQRIDLVGGDAGTARAVVKAKGAALPMPSLPLGGAVRVQLRRSGAGSPCWGATYSTPQRNDATRFSATSD